MNPGSRAERRKNELRERILASAFELFLSQGVSATRIDEICERADIASRTFFNHFPTRQDMVLYFDYGTGAAPGCTFGAVGSWATPAPYPFFIDSAG